MLLALDDQLPAAEMRLGRATQLSARQMATARDVVSLLHQFRRAEGLLSGDPKADALGFVWKALPTVSRLLLTLPADRAAEAAPTDSVLFVPLPPTVLSAFRGLPAAAPAVLLGGDAGPAIKELSRALGAHPEGTVYVLYGQLLMGEKRWAEAEEAFLTAAETPSIVPMRRTALYHAALCAAIHGRINRRDWDPVVLARALRHTRALLALGDVRPDQAEFLVQIALRTGQIDLARAIVGMWERQAPRDLEGVRWRVKVELAGGAYGRAIEAADCVLSVVPQDPVALRHRAEAIAGAREEARRLPSPDRAPPE
jgi:hypothetical protein